MSARLIGRVTQGIRRNLTFQDRCCLAYQLFVAAGVLVSTLRVGPEGAALGWSLSLLASTALTVGLVRSGRLAGGPLRSAVYRAGIFGSMVLSYFSLQTVLPALQPRLLDELLLGLDRALLGETPALLLAPLATSPAVVEWFAFFYFSYYLLLGLAFLPALWGARGSQRTRELFVGATVISCLGYATYIVVPGLGPCAALGFPGPLVGGPWWRTVTASVEAAGAKLDIFPSLHTAFPAFLTLQARAHRQRVAGWWRWAWLVWAFFALNIIVSTMLLRWHYAVDVLAGLLLAGLARVLARRVAAAERCRVERGLQPVWP